MSYKPKFCCECREKIERANWQFWSSGRFCDLCATNFGIYDKLQLGVIILLAVISIGAVGNIVLRKPEKDLIISSNQFSGNKNLAKQSNPQSVQPVNTDKMPAPNTSPVKSVNNTESSKQIFTQPASKEIGQIANSFPTPAEAVYFCGAQTKKGTPCTRRVKNGGRCWQHTGQPAMLPPQKLLASR